MTARDIAALVIINIIVIVQATQLAVRGASAGVVVFGAIAVICASVALTAAARARRR